MKYFRRKYLARKRKKRRLYRFFRVSKQDSAHLRIVRERIGLHEAEAFRQELISYFEKYKETLVLDTSRLDDLDCAGLAVMIQTEGTARKIGEYLIISGLHGKAQDIARMTKLDDLLTNPREYAK